MMEDSDPENMNNIPFYFMSVSNTDPIPEFTEKKNKKWIMFGNDNLYPDYLKDLATRSTYHSAILKTKADMIGGQGVSNDLDDRSQKNLRDFVMNEYNNDDLEEIIFKISQDLCVHGAFALNVIWSKDSKRIAEINYIDVSKIRIAKDDEEGNELEDDMDWYYVSSDWERSRNKSHKPELFQGFSKERRENKSQILYVKEPGLFNTDFYNLPDYISSINWVEMENKISNFKNNYIDNGFFAGFHLNLPYGIPSPEQRDEYIQEMKRQYEGSENAGRTLFTFSNPNDEQPAFKQLEYSFPDDFFTETMMEIQQAILSAHRITNPKILGIKIPGELGSSEGELENDVRTFYNLSIFPKENLIEKTINKLASCNGIGDRIELERYDMFKEGESSGDNSTESNNETA